MSSPEVERFEVTQDDLDNEFNPFRRTFQQSKHQATYGKLSLDSIHCRQFVNPTGLLPDRILPAKGPLSASWMQIQSRKPVDVV